MGCPALGVWVTFLTQPELPGEAPQTKIQKFTKIKIKSLLTRPKILPVLTREPYTSLLHFLLN
jgi:hypothetical protein